MTHAPTITTDRLVLRHHVMADFAPLYALFGSARARFMGGPYSPKQMWYWIASEVGSWSLQGFGSWGLERRDTGAFIGQIGINRPHHFPETEIGWVLLEEHEGQGFAREAAHAALSWAWSNGHDTLVSYIDQRNASSIALAQHLGATQDPNAALPEGDSPSDTLVYRHRRAA
ncbi:MAG: GNAT family N-acetyltransferase [Sulfitobacter sp.]